MSLKRPAIASSSPRTSASLRVPASHSHKQVLTTSFKIAMYSAALTKFVCLYLFQAFESYSKFHFQPLVHLLLLTLPSSQSLTESRTLFGEKKKKNNPALCLGAYIPLFHLLQLHRRPTKYTQDMPY